MLLKIPSFKARLRLSHLHLVLRWDRVACSSRNSRGRRREALEGMELGERVLRVVLGVRGEGVGFMLVI